MRMPRLALLTVVLAGCGGGGGGGKDDRPTPIPTPSATATAAATETPLPSPTPTAVSTFDEVVLGVATRYGPPVPEGARDYQQFALRYAADSWESVPLTVPASAGVFGVTFAGANVAFAFGGGGDSTKGLLLRTDDAGRTWRDVSATLPAEYPQIFDAAFADERSGYVVGRTYFGGPSIVRTTDGGGTWHAVEIPPSTGFELFGIYGLGFRADATELVRYDGGGLVVVRLDDPAIPPMVLSPPEDTSFAGGNAFSIVGSVGWIAEAQGASIRRSDAPGAPWERQLVDDSIGRFLRAIDVRGDHAGVAGGADGASGTVMPLLLTTDDGADWQPAIVDETPGGGIADVLRLRGDAALAVVDVAGSEGGAHVLRSTDGGRSWRHEPTAFERDWQIHDLARNTERAE